MIYTRQQGARDTLDYVAAVSAYVEGTVGEERSAALGLQTSCDSYAMEQWAEWPDETEVHAELDEAC
jgi:hypothetical protein